ARLFVDGHPPADDVGNPAEATLPVPVTDDRHGLRALALVGGRETASEQSLGAKHPEEAAGDQAHIGVRRGTAVAPHRTSYAIARNTRCALEKATLSCDRLDLDVAERVERRARRRSLSPREDQPVLLLHR